MGRTIFEHMTDRLTLVRWSLLHFCSINADGPLSLRGTARLLRCPVYENDTDEGIIERCRSAAQKSMESFRDHIRKQFERFKLEGQIIRSRDQFFETTIASSRANYS
ncbi:hypothetical protein AC1031_016753 [Aphanomyces cochlioides]|nr:hypothetical protein AC1031_016753 [Aphanomyces cochlioides]